MRNERRAGWVLVVKSAMDEGLVEDELWSAREVARFLSLSLWEIEKLRRVGTLSATKHWPFGWRYSSLAVMGYFESLPWAEPSVIVARQPLTPEESTQAMFGEIIKLAKQLEQEALAGQEEVVQADDSDAPPIIKIVNAILSNAIDYGASDIHLEPMLYSLRIRFRVGGVLKEVMHVPKLVQNHFVRRVMVMADIDLARLFVPQVGTIRLQHNRKDYNLRVTAIATLYGHTVTARIMDSALPRKGLQALGMLAEHQVPLEMLLTSAGGLFLFVGPSASGTTTTVAACLHYLNEIERAIYTIEQPIEYELPGVTQIQLNPFCGHTLDKALKTVLRARPDVLFLGSIHDAESARAAVEAAEAGITVLTTMRCTNIPTVFTLLERYGIAPQVQARLVQVVVNQCLVRSQDSETQQAFFESCPLRNFDEMHDLVAMRAPRWKLEEGIKRCRFGPTLEEQLVNLRSRADS